MGDMERKGAGIVAKQTGWIITGALSIAALGAGVAVAGLGGPDQTQDLGGALDVTSESESALSLIHI